MRSQLFWIFLVLALILAYPVLAEEAGAIDPGGIVVERQAEQGSVKGAFAGQPAGTGGGRYWAAVSALAVFSLLIFEAGWRLGEKSSRGHRS